MGLAAWKDINVALRYDDACADPPPPRTASPFTALKLDLADEPFMTRLARLFG
jgi:hypothetical protein